MNFVLGMEPFNYAEIMGIHSSKRKAIEQAKTLEKEKDFYCCQRYIVKTKTQIQRDKIKLLG